jgi:amino acid adenylation domain-containing protein/non-ribosomal peptide synthase protein (TIGR01720 family)
MTVEGYPLSPQQKHVWLAGAPAHLRTRLTAQLPPGIDQPQLDAALRELLARHEILHTAYARVPGVTLPVMVIGKPDWRGVHRGDAPTGIDLAGGLILHAARTGDTLTLELPALAADAASLLNLYAELTALLHGAPLTSETLQYADIAGWFNDILQDADSAAGIAHWRGQKIALADLKRQRLPGERPAPQGGYAPQVWRVPLGGGGQIADTNTLLAAWFALLARLTGLPELTVGVRFDGRPYEELSGAVGLFARTLPVKLALDGATHFADLASRLAAASVEAAAWQVLFDWEQAEGGHGYFPFAFDDTELPAGVTACDAALDRADVRLSITRRGGALEAAFTYDSGRFDEAAIARLAGEYQTLLAGVSADDQPIGAYPLTGAAETALLASFNETAAPIRPARTIHELIEAQAQKTPGAPAVIFDGQMLTYGELDANANRLARHLRAQGVQPGARVALCLERSAEMVVAILGVLKAGGAYVPLDPAYPPERIANMLADSGAGVCISLEKFGDHFSSPQTAIANAVFLDSHRAEIALRDAAPLGLDSAPDDPCYVIYTSGSTGQPKGVVVSHGNLIHSTLARDFVYPEPLAAFLLLSSYSFDSSIVGIFWTLAQGGALVLPRQGEEQDVLRLGELIAAHGVSHLLALPSLYGALIESVPAAKLAALRAAIVAGEACPPALTAAHFAALPGVPLYNEYGPTEGTVWATAHRMTAPHAGATVPIGKPIPNAQAWIVDEYLNLAPVGVPGELLIGGAGVARGYLGRDDLTRERFIDAEKVNRGGGEEETPLRLFSSPLLYKSGDLARWLPDGNIEFLGRADNQVKVRGYRVEPGEIERALAAHPDVRDAVVIAREDEPGRRHLAAYVIPRSGESAGQEMGAVLRVFLQTQLPDYMIPAHFVTLANFPLTPNGKVDRNALPKPEAGAAKAGAFVAPRNEKEAALAEVFREVLGLERVSVTDNFFELGGDSIISIRIVARANLAGMSLNPMQIFQRQTIAELAEVVGEARSIHAEQGAVTGDAPLTPIMRWFFEGSPPEPHHYNMSLLLAVRLHLSRAELDEAVNAVAAHHDALRLRFTRGADGWMAAHAPAGERVPVHWFDLSADTPAAQTAALEAECARLQASLNLETGPTVQAAYFDCGAAGRLFLACHHLAVDIVSLQTLLEDLHTALQETSRGGTVTLPLKTTSFQYWAQRQHALARSDQLLGELAYWLSDNRRNIQPLPLDQPDGRAGNTLGSSRAITVKLTEAETSALLQDVPRVYRTQINDTLLTPLARAISGWTGQNAVLFDLEGHGREDLFEEADLSRTSGWFTTLAPVVLELTEGGDPGADLKSIKEQLRQIPNRGIGYGILRYLRDDAELAGRFAALPQTEINFNYLGKIDSLLPGDRMFSFAGENKGAEQSPRTPRRHLLEVVALVREGCLHVEWTYSERAHHHATVERLAESYLAHLRALIAHCLSAEAGGFTPSDFPEAGLSQAELDDIVGELG